jgi:hypothetical protein
VAEKIGKSSGQASPPHRRVILWAIRIPWGSQKHIASLLARGKRPPATIFEGGERGGNLNIDNDFVIRCMFSVAGIGTPEVVSETALSWTDEVGGPST